MNKHYNKHLPPDAFIKSDLQYGQTEAMTEVHSEVRSLYTLPLLVKLIVIMTVCRGGDVCNSRNITGCGMLAVCAVFFTFTVLTQQVGGGPYVYVCEIGHEWSRELKQHLEFYVHHICRPKMQRHVADLHRDTKVYTSTSH